MTIATPDMVGRVLVSLRRGELYHVVEYDPGPPPCLWLTSFWPPHGPGAWAAHNGTLRDYEEVTS